MIGELPTKAIVAAMERERMDLSGLAGEIGEDVDVLSSWLEDPGGMPLESLVDIAGAFGMRPSALF